MIYKYNIENFVWIERRNFKLTAIISHWATNSLLVNRLASLNVKCALLHNARGLIPDTVAQFARFIRFRRYSRTITVEQSINGASICIQMTNISRSRFAYCALGCCRRQQLYRYWYIRKTHTRSIMQLFYNHKYETTFWTGYHWAALIVALLHFAIFSDCFDKRTDAQVAHQHSIVACAI